MDWYYAEGGQQRGPVSEAEFDNLVVAGTIRRDALVWCEGMAEWQTFGQVKSAGSPGPAAPPAMGSIVFLSANVVYSTVFLGRYGATPGKMLCRLEVVDADGTRIGYGRGLGRGCAEILSRLICLIGYIMAAFDTQKRALHDYICSTRVVHHR